MKQYHRVSFNLVPLHAWCECVSTMILYCCMHDVSVCPLWSEPGEEPADCGPKEAVDGRPGAAPPVGAGSCRSQPAHGGDTDHDQEVQRQEKNEGGCLPSVYHVRKIQWDSSINNIPHWYPAFHYLSNFFASLKEHTEQFWFSQYSVVITGKYISRVL